jgi:DNA-binding NarL/FixJ family response regulator
VTTILLVDDHHLVRAGLASLIDSADDLHVVGQAANGQQALELAATLTPDVVLMDLSMPELDGVETTRRLLAIHSPANVVVLTSFSDQARVADARTANRAICWQPCAPPPGGMHRSILVSPRLSCPPPSPRAPWTTSALANCKCSGW